MEDFINFVKEHSQTNDKTDLFSMNALSGEIGELANVVKKEHYAEFFKEYKIKKSLQKKTFKEDKIDEAGDVLFYFIQFLNRNNISLKEVIEFQINKIDNYSKELGRKFFK